MMVGNQNVPLSIPLPFLLTGACAAALFGLLLPWLLPEALLAPDFPHVLALVHIVTLGWLTMTIMGASLQLVPVIIVGPLRAARLLPWQYPLYLASVTLLVCGFWFMRPWLIIAGGTGVVLAVAHYVIVLAVTLARAPRRPLTVRFLVASLVYLCLSPWEWWAGSAPRYSVSPTLLPACSRFRMRMMIVWAASSSCCLTRASSCWLAACSFPGLP
jgi:hypothetical protein